MTIGEAARRAGLKASAIRYYEQAGLLPKPIRQAGQRRYTNAVLDRLALLEYAKRSGFTLREIRRLFHDSREGASLSARWHKMATAKISQLEKQLGQVRLMNHCGCTDVEQCGRALALNRGQATNY